MCQGGKPDTGKFHSSYIGMNVCGSAYENGCVVNGMCATVLLLLVRSGTLSHIEVDRGRFRIE